MRSNHVLCQDEAFLAVITGQSTPPGTVGPMSKEQKNSVRQEKLNQASNDFLTSTNQKTCQPYSTSCRKYSVKNYSVTWTNGQPIYHFGKWLTVGCGEDTVVYYHTLTIPNYNSQITWSRPFPTVTPTRATFTAQVLQTYLRCQIIAISVCHTQPHTGWVQAKRFPA